MSGSATSSLDLANMFRPPVERGMQSLNRAFFQKTVPLAAARVFQNNQIASCRKDLSQDILDVDRITVVRPSATEGPNASCKSLLLRPEIRPDDSSTWTPSIRQLLKQQKIAMSHYDLKLDYGYWTYLDIMQAILPEDAPEELPTGFSTVGHVAHLNLRDQFLPYKRLVAEVIIDKNRQIRTVINKTDEVGTQSEYRTFSYELLAGNPSLEVEVKELDCTFRFDYSKVYWNSRLNTEHERLVTLFKPGEAVCDVMAGIGPFAVPAGAKRVFVWANDLNPESYACLEDAIVSNKVSGFVRAFNEDGRSFIRNSAKLLMNEAHEVDVTPKAKMSRSKAKTNQPKQSRQYLRRPKVFSHYVMNLPASAIDFLDVFSGLYKGEEGLFAPGEGAEMPMIHVHCFSTKSDDNVREHKEICERISERLGYKMEVSGKDELEIWDVRDVAPNKRMFCASFRLPVEVAFR